MTPLRSRVAWQLVFGPFRSFANMCLPRGGKAGGEPGLRASLWLAGSGSTYCAGRDHRAGDSAHVLRAALCPSLPLDFAASPARRSRRWACRGRCRSPLPRRIATAGRAAQRSQGGDVGRRPASGDMSAAARPVGPILYSPDPKGRSLRTAAMGRRRSLTNWRESRQPENRQSPISRAATPDSSATWSKSTPRRPVPQRAACNAASTAYPPARHTRNTSCNSE